MAKSDKSTELVVGVDVTKIGMHFKTLPPTALVVQKVTPSSWADQVGIEKGDMFLEVGGIPVYSMSADDFRQKMGDRPLTLTLAGTKQKDAAVKMQSHFRRLSAKKCTVELKSAKERLKRLQKSGLRTRHDITKAFF